MLVKLMKYEFRSSARLFLSAYCIFAALLVVDRLSIFGLTVLDDTDLEFAKILSAGSVFMLCFLTVLAIFALFCLPLLFSAIRFYRSTATDEGYLTFTLPVKTEQIIFSKLLVALIWEAATALLAIVLGVLFFMSFDVRSTLEVLQLFPESFFRNISEYPFWGACFAEFLVALPLCAAHGILQSYSAISIGQACGRHKLLASIGIYIGMQFAVSFLSQMLTVPVMFASFRSTDTSLRILQDTLFLSMALNLLLIAGLLVVQFLLCRYFLKKKLNLS